MSIDVETSRIDSGCSLEKAFTKLICMRPSVVLCQTIDQVYSCHGSVCDPLTKTPNTSC